MMNGPMWQRRGPDLPVGRTVITTLTGLVVMVICLWFAWRTLQDFDLARMWDAVGQIGPLQWALALLATSVSFAALGRYDAIWHRILRTGVTDRYAARVGMAAIAVGQAIGANAITSAIARWRGLPQLNPTMLAKLSAGVGLSFMVAWAVCAVVAAAWAELLPQAGLILAVGAGAVLLGLAAMPLVWRQSSVAMLGFTALDLVMAGTALWVLMPETVVMPLGMIVAAYVLALGLGLISNSPGGLGPFELILLTLLPVIPAEDLVAALLAFRIVYYIVPFVVGIVFLAFTRPQKDQPVDRPAPWGLARQSGVIAPVASGWAHIVHPMGLPVSLGDPMQTSDLPRHPVYKASGRLAAIARAKGWQVTRIADDATINLREWTLDGSRKKRLRQALRRAQARGVTAQIASALPQAAMTRIAADWSKMHGGELGLTMGRFCPRSISDQTVILIYHNAMLVGFISCDVTPDGWALDLIRYGADLPEGAVHVALHHAIAAAHDARASVFHLGAVPADTGPLAKWSKGKEGLRRFKALYDPNWSPRYFAAPSAWQAWPTAAALAMGIQRPFARKLSLTHHLHAAFGLAFMRLLGQFGLSQQQKQVESDASQCPFPPSEDPRLATG